MSLYRINLNELSGMIEKQKNLIEELESAQSALRNLVDNNLNEDVYSGQDANAYRVGMNSLIDGYIPQEKEELVKEHDVFVSAYDLFTECRNYAVLFGRLFNVATQYTWGSADVNGMVLCDTDLVEYVSSLCDSITETKDVIDTNLASAINEARDLRSNSQMLVDIIREAKNDIDRLEILCSHKEQLQEYAEKVVAADDWLSNSLLEIMPESVVATHNAEFSFTPELSLYISLVLKEDPNEDDIKLRNRLYNMIVQDKFGLANALEVVKGKDVNELTEQDYVLMATIFECGVENKNVDLINGVLTIANDWSVSNQMQVGEQWYIYGGPASAILSYIDPVKSGTAYYSYSMFLNIEREKPTDIVDPIIISYIDAGGALCFGAVDSYLFENGQYDIPADNELDLTTYTLRYAARFVDMNEYMTESAMDNLKTLGFSEEEIRQFYAGIGSDEDVRCVADLAELVPRALDEHWADEYWEKVSVFDDVSKLTASCGASIASYAYHICFGESGSCEQLQTFVNGLLRVEDINLKMEVVGGVSTNDKRAILLDSLSNGANKCYIDENCKFTSNPQSYMDWDTANQYYNRKFVHGLFAASLGHISSVLSISGYDLEDVKITDYSVLDLRILTDGIDIKVDYNVSMGRDAKDSEHGTEVIGIVINDDYSGGDLRDDTINSICCNIRDRKFEHKTEHVISDIKERGLSWAVDTAVSKLGTISVVYSICSEVGACFSDNALYLYEIDTFDREEVSVNGLARYLGNTCTYSIGASEESFLFRHDVGPQTDVVISSTIYEPATYYLFEQMANGAGASDYWTLADMETISGGENVGDSVTGIGDYDTLEYIRQMYYGGFNAFEYIEENGAEEFLRLTKAYDDFITGEDADIDKYFNSALNEWYKWLESTP